MNFDITGKLFEIFPTQQKTENKELNKQQTENKELNKKQTENKEA